ncbi:MAG: caspase family protein [Cyanobacteria bacterium P01_A01_bin.114]
MKKRKALLIGVPEYESDVFGDLPVVRRDLEILHAALEKSGYGVRAIGTEGIEQTGQNKILRALRQELREAKGLDVLLLYFSGHGMHYEGKDYLIPSDADFDDPAFEQYLITPDALSDVIDRCSAKTILFVVDACRHGTKLGVKEVGLTNWSRGEVRKATHRSYVLIFACGPGQVSQYVRGEEGFSLFTQAFAQAIDADHPACQLNDVLQVTQEKLNSLVEIHAKSPQKIRRLLESEIEDDTLKRIICEGSQPSEKSEESIDPWSDVALNSPLWLEDTNDEQSTAGQLKQKVVDIVSACWQQWQTSKTAFPNDAWRDENLPVRVLDRLDLLVSGSDPPIKLSDAEIALVIVVPFIREAVLASGILKAAQCHPLSLNNKDKKEGLGLALDKLHQAQPRFIRKAKRLEEQGQIEDKDAVMAWLMHRCLLKSLEVWQPESEGGYLSQDLDESLGETSSCQHRLVKDTLTKSRLLELSRCIFADFERIDRDDRPDALQAEVSVRGRSYREEQVIREKLLAYLLKLAGLLAIDIRILSDVITDHIGLADPLNPRKALKTIAKTEWKPAGRGRKLTVICHHPAIDLALNEHVDYSATVLTHIFRQIGEKIPGSLEMTE